MDSLPTNVASDKSCEARKGLGVLVEEAGGFFHQQGALVSGVPVWHGLPSSRSGMGRCPRYRANLCKEYKIVSKMTYTDKYKNNS